MLYVCPYPCQAHLWVPYSICIMRNPTCVVHIFGPPLWYEVLHMAGPVVAPDEPVLDQGHLMRPG